MLIVVMMGTWYDDSTCLVVRLYSVLRHRGDDVCCSMVVGTLVGMFMFRVVWSDLLVTSAIS